MIVTLRTVLRRVAYCICLPALGAVGCGPSDPPSRLRIQGSSSHDFGEIEPGSGVQYHTFTVINDSNEPVEIVDTYASCGCSSVEFRPRRLAPSGRGELKVGIDVQQGAKYTEEAGVYIKKRPGRIEARITITATGLRIGKMYVIPSERSLGSVVSGSIQECSFTLAVPFREHSIHSLSAIASEEGWVCDIIGKDEARVAGGELVQEFSLHCKGAFFGTESKDVECRIAIAGTLQGGKAVSAEALIKANLVCHFQVAPAQILVTPSSGDEIQLVLREMRSDDASKPLLPKVIISDPFRFVSRKTPSGYILTGYLMDDTRTQTAPFVRGSIDIPVTNSHCEIITVPFVIMN